MGNRSNPDSWFARCRLAWLERHASLTGGINRSELMAAFGIGPAQSSADLQAYQDLNPCALLYSTTDKAYIWQRGASFAITPAPWAEFPVDPTTTETTQP